MKEMESADEIFAVVLAGGSGTRFWPASRRLLPKQLLALGPSAPQSLIESTLQRLEGLVSSDHIYVATGTHLLDTTRKALSLPNDAYLAEPRAKNTAPCIAWAARVIARENPQALVCVLPSDQYAEDEPGFRSALSAAIQVAKEGSICTIGIVPSRPETGYGYIEKGDVISAGVTSAHRVSRFVEKPDLKTAQEYIATGRYYWNAGIFVFRAQEMLNAIERHMPAYHQALHLVDQASQLGEADERQAVEEFFEHCESLSIDYAVMEKEDNLCVVPGDFGWSDLGSWQSAWELSEKNEQGNVCPQDTVLIDAQNNLVADLRKQSQEKKAIALVGVDNLVVVQTDDALLVMPREKAQDVKLVVEELKRSKRGELT